MNLSDLASIGSFLSGVAVLLSLVYLTLQVRQARAHQQSLIKQGRANLLSDLCFRGADPAVADAWRKGTSGAADITATQLEQFYWMCRGVFFNAEDTFYQHKAGLVSDETFAAYTVGTRAHNSNPGVRAQWRRLRPAFMADFAAFMDATMEGPLSPASDALAAWQADIAAEKSRSAQ